MKQGLELGVKSRASCGLDGCYGSVDRPMILALNYNEKYRI
jgi:hypothetical protein